VRDNYSRGAASSARECPFDRRRSSRVNLAPELKQPAAASATDASRAAGALVKITVQS